RARREHPRARAGHTGARHVPAGPGGPGGLSHRRAAPARAGPLRSQLRAAVRQAARLLRHRVAVRAAHLHARDRPRRQTRAGVHARLLPPGLRPVHRDHDDEPEARDEEEPEGAPSAGGVPGGAGPRPLPARLPASAREVRPRGAFATGRRRRQRRAGEARPVPTAGVDTRPARRVRVSDLRRSPLDAAHRALGARMVEFGGWEMPIQYTGVLDEHRACREHAVVFDVSHLGSVRVAGQGAFDLLQWAFTNDLHRIGPGRAQYTHLLDPDDAHVVDDIIVWWVAPDEFLVMPNASNTARIAGALSGDDAVSRSGGAVAITDVTAERAVLAVQGPEARERLRA